MEDLGRGGGRSGLRGGFSIMCIKQLVLFFSGEKKSFGLGIFGTLGGIA